MATVTITASALRKAFKWVQPDPKLPLPVLHNVRVSVTAGQLATASSDWETWLLGRARGPGDGGTATVLVPDGQLEAALDALPGGAARKVEVTVHDGNKVDLVTGTGTTAQRISVGQDCDPADYPAMPAFPPITGWADSAVLVPALTQIAGCCSTEAQLPLICAVHFIPGDGTLKLEGTSRYVIGLDQVPFNRAQGDLPSGFLIPARLVTRFAKKCEGPVFISAPGPDGMALLSDGWHTLVTKVTAGDYPNMKTIAARHRSPVLAEVTLDPQPLHAAAGEAALLLGVAVGEMIDAAIADESDERTDVDKRRAIRLEHANIGMFLTVAPDGTWVSAVHHGTGEQLGRWPVAETTSPEPVTVGLNPGYLRAVLPETGTVTLRLAAPLKAVHLTHGLGAPRAGFEGIIMPVNATPPARTKETQPA